MTVNELSEVLDVLKHYDKGHYQIVIKGLQMKISAENVKSIVVDNAKEVILKEVKR